MWYGLTYIFPRVRRLNDIREPFGNTGLLIEYLNHKEVTVYWGTQDRTQHFVVEDLDILQIERNNNGKSSKGLSTGDLQKKTVPEKSKMALASNGQRKKGGKWWRRLQRSS